MKTCIHHRLLSIGLCAAVVALGQVQAKVFSKVVEDYSLGTDFLRGEYLKLSVATVNNGSKSLPASFDWQHKLPPVKDQGMAAVSWAFATVAAAEAVQLIQYPDIEEPVSLSEQELIDCQESDNLPYCGGLSVFDAASYIQRFGVLPAEIHPYQARWNDAVDFIGYCILLKINEDRVKIGEFLRPQTNGSSQEINPASELTLMQIIHQYGPVIGHIAVDQEKTEFNYSYTGATVITENTQMNPNHAVLIVGWGEDQTSGQKYWLVRNSWGRHWGHYGYAKIARGSNAMRLEEFVMIPTPSTNNELTLDKLEPSSLNHRKPYYAKGLRNTPQTRNRFLTIPIAPDNTRQEFIAAKEWDWRKQGKVSPVKDQKLCGSCWAFAVIEAVESALAIHANQSTVPELSTQQLLDCSFDYSNDGNAFDSQCSACCGGVPADGLEFMEKHGITTEEAYPYEWALRKCQKAEGPVYKITSYQRAKPISPGDRKTSDEEIMRLVQTYGPVVVSIYAKPLEDYIGGIIDQPRNSSPDALDHAVAIVGWGTSDTGVDFWIVRNSWGEHFGEKGYFRVMRGTDNNVLGINDEVVVPVV